MEKSYINLVDLNREEVLRYLEYNGQEIDNNLENIINDCIKITIEKIKPRYIIEAYNISKAYEENEYKVFLEGTNLVIKSKEVYNLLSDSDKCIIMSATLGIEIEKEIRKNSFCALTKSIIIDACATVAIEQVCDLVQSKIEKGLTETNKYLTNRYSPGYGDLPLETNKYIINILDATKEIGLTITEKNIMIPRKSVVAIMGITTSKVKQELNKCLACSSYEKCKYKKGDGSCEHKGIYKR